jgi:hypothetical protein
LAQRSGLTLATFHREWQAAAKMFDVALAESA